MFTEITDFYYLRLSAADQFSDSQKDESGSISSQRMRIRQYILDHPELGDINQFEEIVDDGYSGTNMNRPGMERLLSLVEAGMVGKIIVKDLSRFARNYLEAGHYLEFVFPLYNVRFISIEDNYDSAALQGDTGGFQLGIRNLINQMYSRDLSKKIKSAVDLKKLKGEYVYGTAPYGYKKGEQKNTIVIDEEAAAIVRCIFQWAAEGITLSQIARRLNDQKISTPSAYLADIRGKYQISFYWKFISVNNIIKNRIYTGDTVPFKSHVVAVGSDRVKVLPEEEWIIIPDTHEAIISREMYFQAQRAIKKHKITVRPTTPSLFTSLLVCGVCGNRLHKGKKVNKTWRCLTARYSDAMCKEVAIHEDTLREIVIRAIKNACDLFEEKMRVETKQLMVVQTEYDQIEQQIQRLKKQVEKHKATKMSYYEDYVNGSISKEEYINLRQDISKTEEILTNELADWEYKSTECQKQMQNQDKAVNQVQCFVSYPNTAGLTNDQLKNLVKRMEIYPEGKIRIVWNFHDNFPIIVAEIAESGNV